METSSPFAFSEASAGVFAMLPKPRRFGDTPSGVTLAGCEYQRHRVLKFVRCLANLSSKVVPSFDKAPRALLGSKFNHLTMRRSSVALSPASLLICRSRWEELVEALLERVTQALGDMLLEVHEAASHGHCTEHVEQFMFRVAIEPGEREVVASGIMPDLVTYESRFYLQKPGLG